MEFSKQSTIKSAHLMMSSVKILQQTVQADKMVHLSGLHCLSYTHLQFSVKKWLVITS